MTEQQRMTALYRSVYQGDAKGEAWHGPALKPLLKDVTNEAASETPWPEAHSIFQFVMHIAYWEEVAARRLSGEIVEAPINSPDDWPPNRKLTVSEWDKALQRLQRSHENLAQVMERFPAGKLEQLVPGRDHTNYILLHGMINHCVYHTAQIALLKKMLAK
jgi:uncharacterized damage-inducible protein DinB